MEDIAGGNVLFQQKIDKEMQHGRLAASPDAADREYLFPPEKLSSETISRLFHWAFSQSFSPTHHGFQKTKAS